MATEVASCCPYLTWLRKLTASFGCVTNSGLQKRCMCLHTLCTPAEQSIVVDCSILNSLHPPVAFHCLNKDGQFLISIKYLIKYSDYSLLPQFRMQALSVFLI